MNILNENELKTIDTMKRGISTPTNFQTLPDEATVNVTEWTGSILNALDAFDSEHFVVACIGMLKSGKSTLINLLARNRNASPTGFGYDTTLRPALITCTLEPQGMIEIWLPNAADQKLTKASLNEVFLCLRGVKKSTDVKSATCHQYPLTPANLENALCKAVLEADQNMLPCEPVMVVVKVPQNKESPLSSEIVLLDTPGLDSGISEWTTGASERYSWIIENSDLLLFLQSSVAPLNRNATAILHDIHARSPNTPVWLVQNEMCAKPWLPPERITEENTKQRTQAARMFNTVSHAFKQVYANLGKADSAIFDDSLGGKLRRELLHDSQFCSLEQNVRNDLIRNIGPIRRRNCIDAVVREVQTMLDGLDGILKQLEAQLHEKQNRVDALERFRTQFRDYLLNTPRDHDKPAADEVRLVPNGHFNPAKYKRELHYCHDFEFNDKVFSRGKLQRIITGQKAALVKQMKDDIRVITTGDFMLSLRRNGEHRNNICQYVHEVFRDFVLRMLKDDSVKFEPCFSTEEAETMIRSVVERLELPNLHDGFFVNVEEATGKVTVSVRKLDTWKNLLWEFRKRDTGEAQQAFSDYFKPITEAGPFAEMIKAVAEKIREGVAVWMNKTAFDALSTDFIAKLDEALINHRCKARETLSLIERDVAAIKAMLRRCYELKNQMKAL